MGIVMRDNLLGGWNRNKVVIGGRMAIINHLRVFSIKIKYLDKENYNWKMVTKSMGSLVSIVAYRFKMQNSNLMATPSFAVNPNIFRKNIKRTTNRRSYSI